MTPEQRIAQLEAELVRERETSRRLLAIVEANATERAAAATAKATRSARNARHRSKTSTETVCETSHETRTETVSPLPPPLDGSPPLPAPISPSPLSSPPSLFSAASPRETSETAARGTEAPKRQKPSTVAAEFAEWAKAETRKHLAPDAPDNCRLDAHQWPRLGQALKEHGLEACKAAFRLWMGWQGAQAAGYPLGMFVAKWEGWVGQVKAPASKPASGSGKGSTSSTDLLAIAKTWGQPT